MSVAPDGRIFVSEPSGNIRVIKDGRVLDTPFATVKADTTVSQGLMSIAFDPQFPTKPFVYAYFVTPASNGALRNRVSRFTATGDVADPASEKVIFNSETFRIAPGQPAHNGGAITFGGDGKLYLSTGDMLDSKHAQQLSNSFGKILRLNPDGSIPRDNPFYRRTRGLGRAIWVYGLRNPYTMTFQPGSGRLLINDVGGARYEEINLGAKGANYGWPNEEGPTTRRGIRSPIYSYTHGQPGPRVDAAVIGGAFYTVANPSFPGGFTGKYFFADYAQGFIKTLDISTRAVETFATDLGQGVVDVDIDSNGRLYYLTIGGSVNVIQYAPQQPPSLSKPLEDVLVPKDEPASLTVSAQGSFPFQYQWQVNQQDIEQATEPTLTIPADQIDNTALYRVIVTNEFGSVTSQEVHVATTNDYRPTAKILTPSANAKFRIGDLLKFAGVGTDPEAPGGVLPASQLRWHLDLLHNTHVHPNTYVVDGRDSGSFKIPGHADPGQFSLRLTLIATDSAGQTAQSSIVFKPTAGVSQRRRRR